MALKILLTGGTGFVGTAVRSALLRQGHLVRILVRSKSRDKWSSLGSSPAIELVNGDVTDLLSMKRAAEAVDIVVHLVGIIREGSRTHETFEYVHVTGTETVIEAAQDRGVSRIIYVSALGARPDACTRYHTTKYTAEQRIIQSGLGWTILRPSILWHYESPFVMMLKRRIHPVIPFIIPGPGKAHFQPVFVDNFAAGLALLLMQRISAGQIFEIGGPESLTLPEMIDRIAADRGLKKVMKIPVPRFFMAPIIASLQYMPFFPLTYEQFKLINEDNITSDRRFWEMIRITPIPFLNSRGGTI